MADAQKTSDLYESDFYAWTQDQAARLRARASFDNRGDIDWVHAAEEIEGVGASEKREIRSRLRVLLLRLLKWGHQPERRSQSWRRTIRDQRLRIAMAVEDSPSLVSFPADALDGAYTLAISSAVEETSLDEAVFPSQCPFTIDEILDPAFLPELR